MGKRSARSHAARWASPLSGFKYRGPGKVTFDPPISPVVHGQPVTLTSKASFSAPGTYVLRSIAFDGQLFTNSDVTVTVNPGASGADAR